MGARFLRHINEKHIESSNVSPVAFKSNRNKILRRLRIGNNDGWESMIDWRDVRQRSEILYESRESIILFLDGFCGPDERFNTA